MDVPPSPPTPPTPPTPPVPPQSSMPVMVPPKSRSTFRVLLIVGGVLLVLLVLGALVNNNHGSASCVDWRTVSNHVRAAKAAGSGLDLQTMISETEAASAAASKDVTVSSDLNRAAGWMRAGDFQHATSDLNRAVADIQGSSLPQC